MQLDLMRDKARTMPALGEIESLRIWHCGYRSLEPVGRVAKLETLVIATFPDDSLACLRPLRSLRYLSIVHMPRVKDLAPLSELTKLECLSLETLPSWDSSGKLTEVESLDPLSKLVSLRHLQLLGVVPKSRSLNSLERCSALLSARFSKYPKDEVRRFYSVCAVSDAHVPEPESWLTSR